jgi:hypothetical protein
MKTKAKKEKKHDYVIWTWDTANMREGQFYEIDIVTGVMKKHETRRDTKRARKAQD